MTQFREVVMEAKIRIDLDAFWWRANGICGWIRLLGKRKFKDDSKCFYLFLASASVNINQEYSWLRTTTKQILCS